MASEKQEDFSEVIEIKENYWMYEFNEGKLFHVKQPPKEKKKGLFGAFRNTITVLDFVMMPKDKWEDSLAREEFIANYLRRIGGRIV